MFTLFMIDTFESLPSRNSPCKVPCPTGAAGSILHSPSSETRCFVQIVSRVKKTPGDIINDPSHLANFVPTTALW